MVAFSFRLKESTASVTYELTDHLRDLVLTSATVFSHSSKADPGLTGEHACNTDACAVENFRKGILFPRACFQALNSLSNNKRG